MTKKGDGHVDLNLKVRILISAAIENDNDLFSILTYTAVSFLVLFGIQQDYTLTWTLMIVFYVLVSSLESIRVVLAYLSVHYNAKGHGELVFSSENMYEQFSKMSKDQVLKPKNVYENLGREYYLVFMIFITQVVLITFVVRTCTISFENMIIIYPFLFRLTFLNPVYRHFKHFYTHLY